MNPAVSLIMCSLGADDRLGALLRLAESLGRQSNRDFELIVVDQAEPGRLDAFVAALPDWLPVTRIESPRGLSRARNAGLRVARGAIISLPDDDAWLPDGLIDDLISCFRDHPDHAYIGGVTRDADGELSNGTFLDQEAEVTPANAWKAGNANSMFFRAEPARAVGWFDESLGVGSGTPFGSGEDQDFLLRLRAAGHRCMFKPDLMMHHDQVDQVVTPANLKRAQLYAQGYGRVLRLHGYSRRFAAWRSTRSAVAAMLALGRGNRLEARRKLIWCRGILEGYRQPV